MSCSDFPNKVAFKFMEVYTTLYPIKRFVFFMLFHSYSLINPIIMFLYISKYVSSLGTDIISPMNEDVNDNRSINYSNHHAKFGLFKFLISLF